ncbi:glucosaminidase domain-containing protein [Alphaproteobacteria bacterium]|nr:glucosaminidase domain-containing protein [Alphaproteobacteria bacterium]
MLTKFKSFIVRHNSSRYAYDLYFFLITLTLFILGFLVPKDKKLDPDQLLQKQYEFNVTKLKKHSIEFTDEQINNNDFVLEWSKKTLTQVHKKGTVSREFFNHIPKKMNEINTVDKKNIFISILLPIALRGNELVLEEREFIKDAISSNDLSQIEYFSKRYKIKDYKKINFAKLSVKQVEEIKSKLLIKVNKIPISMILAQAIIESGWGSSRFAKEGNALFGEWTWQKGIGIKPQEKLDANYAVKNFSNISASLNSYILNLNRHEAYNEMRNYRNKKYRNGDPITGYEAANFLSSYAEIGYQYVTKVKDMIKFNKLERFENLVLE